MDLRRYEQGGWRVGHLKVFATAEFADEWFKKNDPESVAFGYEVIEE